MGPMSENGKYPDRIQKSAQEKDQVEAERRWRAGSEVASQVQGLTGLGMPCRQLAVDVLLDKAARLERKARGLRALAAVIPRDGLTAGAEEAIWEAVSEIR